MVYLNSFSFPSQLEEDNFILSFPPQFEMQCYSNNNAYPFKLFPFKGLEELEFEPVTIIYGGNGSGKSTILNIIAEKLKINRSSPFNYTPCFPDYLERCEYSIAYGIERIPHESKIITSDDVFDFLLNIRAINEGIDNRREELFLEYYKTRESPFSEHRFNSLDDFEDLKRRNEAKRQTKSKYVSRRMPKELQSKSNGESAYLYFTQKIGENAIYLLDEPENSLSAKLQSELCKFIEDSARFYGCQFIISTHSPFLLSMKNSKIYDLDSSPIKEKHWTELENVRVYYDFFKEHMNEFK